MKLWVVLMMITVVVMALEATLEVMMFVLFGIIVLHLICNLGEIWLFVIRTTFNQLSTSEDKGTEDSGKARWNNALRFTVTLVPNSNREH